MAKSFDFTVEFDAKGLENKLMDRFGPGSEAQRFWSELVFEGSVPYMPMETETFINLSRMYSKMFYADGELYYPGPAAHYLWEGILYVDPDTKSPWARAGVTKEPTGKPLKYTGSDYAGPNPKAGPRWAERASNDLYDTWRQQLQDYINRGQI